MPVLGQNVSQIYQNKLGRAADVGGLDYWTQQQQAGMSLEDIRARIAGSAEGVKYGQTGRGAYVAPGQQIEGVDYRSNLGDVPGAYTSSVTPVGELNAQQLQQIYQNKLGRSIGKEGAEFYLNSGLSAAEIEAQIGASPEAQKYAASGVGSYVDPSQQYGDISYRYNVDDPYAATGRGQTGLAGAETEYGKALSASQQGLGEFADVMSPWAEGGKQAYDLQLALSGALGPEAQAEAFKNYKESPGQDWLKEQSRREIENYAAATGQSLGGNVLDEINRRAMGLAMQDYGAQYERIGGAARIGGQAANVLGQGYLGSGQFDANLLARFGDLRYGAGRDIAEGLGQTTTALSGLQERQGVRSASEYAFSAGKISNMVSRVAEQMGRTPMEVATVLANMATQSGSAMAPYLSREGGYDAAGTAGYYEAMGNTLMGVVEAFDFNDKSESGATSTNYNSGSVNPVDYSGYA